MRLAGGQTSKNDACGRILRANVSSVCRGEGGRKEREGEREREVRRCALLYKIIGVAKSVCAKDELRLGRLRARVCRADALPMVAGCVIFHRRQLLLREPRIPPPSFCSFDPSRFLPSRSPSSFTLRSQPLLLLLLLLLLLVDPSLSFSLPLSFSFSLSLSLQYSCCFDTRVSSRLFSSLGGEHSQRMRRTRHWTPVARS